MKASFTSYAAWVSYMSMNRRIVVRSRSYVAFSSSVPISRIPCAPCVPISQTEQLSFPAHQNEAEGEALISEIEGELRRLSVQDEELVALRLEATEVRPWGAFDPAAVSQLSEAGYALSFFTIPQARFTEAFQAEYDVVPVATLSGRVYFVHLHAAGASQTLPETEHVATPKRSIAELEGLVAEAEAARAQAAGEAHRAD